VPEKKPRRNFTAAILKFSHKKAVEKAKKHLLIPLPDPFMLTIG